jgi:hypothetical protein
MGVTSQYIETETELSITYPDAPSGLSDAAAAIPAAVIWDRIEAYCNFRWSETVTEFIVDPPCEIEWQPPYLPFTIDTVNGEAATPGTFGAVTLSEKSKVVCTIGGATPNETVNSAYRRLAEYVAAMDDAPKGVTRYSIGIGDLSESWSRRADHMARAMDNSGAADLLRKFRKAGRGYL